MDAGKEIIFKERRKARAKDVDVVFTTPTNFNVVDDDRNLKYVGCIDPFDCTCQSFMQLNNSKYESTHPGIAKCKHIYKALKIRGIEN